MHNLLKDRVSAATIKPFIADNKINDKCYTDFLLLAIGGSVPSVISKQEWQKLCADLIS